MNKILKDKKPKKLLFKKALITGLAVLCLTSTVSCLAPKSNVSESSAVSTSERVEQVLYKPVCPIPTRDQVTESLGKIFNDPSESFIITTNDIGQEYGKFCRRPCPTDGSTIKVYFLDATDESERALIDYSLKEYNDIFAIINPNYKFEAVYAFDDSKIDPYAIKVLRVDHVGDSKRSALGVTDVISYDVSDVIDDLEIYNTKIEILSTLKGDFFESTFKHEFFHTLGGGDAYLNEKATKDSIMQKGTSFSGSTLRNVDVQILDALYRDPNNTLTNEQIDYFTHNYNTLLENNEDFMAFNTPDKYSFEKFVLQNAKASLKNIVNNLSAKNLDDFEISAQDKARLQEFFSSHTAPQEIGDLSKFRFVKKSDDKNIYKQFIKTTLDSTEFEGYSRRSQLEKANIDATFVSVFKRQVIEMGDHANIDTTRCNLYINFGDTVLQIDLNFKENDFMAKSKPKITSIEEYKTTEKSLSECMQESKQQDRSFER